MKPGANLLIARLVLRWHLGFDEQASKSAWLLRDRAFEQLAGSREFQGMLGYRPQIIGCRSSPAHCARG